MLNNHTASSQNPTPCPSLGGGGGGGGEGGRVELKELPARRRLDCAKGVDFGGEDAAWMERKDLPMDYESPGLAQS